MRLLSRAALGLALTLVVSASAHAALTVYFSDRLHRDLGKHHIGQPTVRSPYSPSRTARPARSPMGAGRWRAPLSRMCPGPVPTQYPCRPDPYRPYPPMAWRSADRITTCLRRRVSGVASA